VLSLGPSHSFPLHDVFRYLRAGSVRDVLVQGAARRAMFTVAGGWKRRGALACRASRGRRCARSCGGHAVRDLLAAAPPAASVACAENIGASSSAWTRTSRTEPARR